MEIKSKTKSDLSSLLSDSSYVSVGFFHFCLTADHTRQVIQTSVKHTRVKSDSLWGWTTGLKASFLRRKLLIEPAWGSKTKKFAINQFWQRQKFIILRREIDSHPLRSLLMRLRFSSFISSVIYEVGDILGRLSLTFVLPIRLRRQWTWIAVGAPERDQNSIPSHYEDTRKGEKVSRYLSDTYEPRGKAP